MTRDDVGTPPPTDAELAFYGHLTKQCALVDFGDRTQIELTGRDRQRFLHNLCTNDIVRLTPGSGCEAFATNVQGKCLAHLLVFARADSLVVETAAAQAGVLIPFWDRYLITEDVQLIDRGDVWTELLVAGADAPQVLARLGFPSIPEQQYEHIESTSDGGTWQLRRVPMLGVPTFLAACARADQPRLTAGLAQAGAVSASPDVGCAAFHMARIEHGFPWFGWDITDKNLPQEVERNSLTIHFNKGCYLGQETIARIDALGHVNRVLSRLQASFKAVPSPGTQVTRAGQSIGTVTSSAYSPRRQAPLAMAYLRREHSQPGTAVDLPLGPAQVVSLTD
jgi:folate-binding protein YgfZ